jgi:hypothetical protein
VGWTVGSLVGESVGTVLGSLEGTALGLLRNELGRMVTVGFVEGEELGL